MNDHQIKSELDSLECALKEKIDYFATQEHELTRKEISDTLQLMSNDIVVHLQHILY